MAERQKVTCAACGATAFNGWSDDAMMEEFHRLHPGVELKDACLICDGCHEIELRLGLVYRGTLQ